MQIAKSFGADVTGVCGTKNLEFVRSLGAGRVIDSTCEDFTQGSERYDLLLDNVGNRSLWAMKRVLNPNGNCVMTGAPRELWRALIRVLKGFLWPPFLRQKFKFLVANINRNDLTTFGELIKTGKVIPMIDRRYPLAQTSEAIAYVEQGHGEGHHHLPIDKETTMARADLALPRPPAAKMILS